jgi:hypothetical protein
MNYGDAVKTWEVELNGETHHFRMEHNFWSGEKKYFIDDDLVEHVSGSLKASANLPGMSRSISAAISASSSIGQWAGLCFMIFMLMARKSRARRNMPCACQCGQLSC